MPNGPRESRAIAHGYRLSSAGSPPPESRISEPGGLPFPIRSLPHLTPPWDQLFFSIFLYGDRIEAPHRRKRGIVARDRDAGSLAMHVADFRYHRHRSKMLQLSGRSTRPAVDDERVSRRETAKRANRRDDRFDRELIGREIRRSAQPDF